MKNQYVNPIERLGQKRKSGLKLSLTKEQYKTIRIIIRGNKKYRYQARDPLLINMQVNTSFRSFDILKLRIGEVFFQEQLKNQILSRQNKADRTNMLEYIQ